MCQNSLFASLTHADTVKKQMVGFKNKPKMLKTINTLQGILKNAFGKKAAIGALGRDFESFMKSCVKELDREKEVSETFFYGQNHFSATKSVCRSTKHFTRATRSAAINTALFSTRSPTSRFFCICEFWSCFMRSVTNLHTLAAAAGKIPSIRRPHCSATQRPSNC